MKLKNWDIIGIGFLYGIGIGLSALKVFGLTDLGWWYVTFPLWIAPVSMLCVALLGYIVASIQIWLEKKGGKNGNK